jgi:segregation and condensation protein B
MDKTELKPILEALIFASDTPLTVDKIKQTLENVTKKEIDEAIGELQNEYQEQNRAFQIKEVANGFQFRTQPAFSPWLKKLKKTKPFRLTQPTLETLAIIAYRQPITKMEIEKIRGVDSGGVMKTLLEKKLISIAGKKDVPGKPFLFATTKTFLEVFGLENLSSLPTLKDIEDLDNAQLPTPVREPDMFDETEYDTTTEQAVEPGEELNAGQPEQPDADCQADRAEQSDAEPEREEQENNEDERSSCVDG